MTNIVDKLCSGLNERGNIWLVMDDMHSAYFDLGDNTWLCVSVRPEDYPGFNVYIMTTTAAELAKFIRKERGGWLIRKLNIDGVTGDVDGCVVGEDE